MDDPFLNGDKIEPRILNIIKWPDERLKTRCKDVPFDEFGCSMNIGQMVIDMVATMIKYKGIGLAAPQVGITLRVIVLLVDNQPIVFINPIIISQSDDMFKWEEGCLSVPGYYEDRERPNAVVVKYSTIHGDEKEAEFRGLCSFALQHEIDHLEGKVFVDELSSLKRDLVKRKIRKTLNL